MRILDYGLKMSISLSSNTYKNADAFAQAGFEAAEFCFVSNYHDRVDLSIHAPYLKEAYPLIKDSGLRIQAYHIPFGIYWDISSPDETIRKNAVVANSAMIELVADLEGENVVIHPSFEPIEEADRLSHIIACQQSLVELAPIAQKAGKKIALENLPRTCLGRTSQEMETITKSGTLCGVCMDTTHMFHETPAQFLQRCGDYVINTHLSDYVLNQNECHFVPGVGDLNWKQIVEGLKEHGYQGTHNFEVFKYLPLEIVCGLRNSLSRG